MLLTTGFRMQVTRLILEKIDRHHLQKKNVGMPEYWTHIVNNSWRRLLQAKANHKILGKLRKLRMLCSTLQIFIFILLCKSIKVMGKMYKLMIGKILRTSYPWIPGIVKQL